MKRLFGATLAFALSTIACLDAAATPVTITTPYFNLENRAINSLGFSSGEFFRVGANSVVPNGNAGTTGVGSTIRLTTGTTFSGPIPFSPGPLIPDFFQRLMAYDASLTGPWTLRFTNGADASQVVVTLPAGQTQAPFISSITLSGSSTNPTFSWAPPPGATVNGYRINIYDKSLVAPGNNGQVSSRNLLPSTTSYTVTGADFTVPGYAFQLNRNYVIEISLIQTKDGSSSNLNNDNLAAISRTYADFRATNSGGPVVNLPVVLPDGTFQFNMAVVAGQTYYLDPAVAVGYDFRTAAGNPSFGSVVLPAGIGDGLYDIYALDMGGATTLLAHDWAAGAVFSFGAQGLTGFRIGGIEPSAGLDPADVTAFVTGVTFVADGLFTGTQTPLVLNVTAVPEPETYALLIAGLGVMGLVARRRRAPKR